MIMVGKYKLGMISHRPLSRTILAFTWRQSWPISRYWHGMCLKRQRKTMENLVRVVS